MSLMNKICWWVVKKWPKRVRYINRGDDPYLLRFYITRPRTNREIKEEPETFGLYLHHFYRGDEDEELHNHPWKWALSWILSGQYSEEREDGVHVRKTGHFNYISHDTFHRVTLVDQDTTPIWTLFLVGPRITSWGFKDKHTGEFWDWEKFLVERG